MRAVLFWPLNREKKRSLANATLNGSELTVLKSFKKVYEPGGEMKRSPGPSFYTISPPIILYSYTVLVPVCPKLSGKGLASRYLTTLPVWRTISPVRFGPSAKKNKKDRILQ
jgi:hypothetical protein